MSRSHPYRHPYIPAVKVSALAVCLAMAGSVGAVQLQFDNGMTGTFDTTISAGVSVRTQDVNGTLVGIANGGASRSVNGDDGDRAYHKNRPFSELLKATHDLELKYEGWGLFARGLYFIDFKNLRKFVNILACRISFTPLNLTKDCLINVKKRGYLPKKQSFFFPF